MIDTWFKKDLEKIFNTHPIVVFIDESKEASFLLEEVKSSYEICKTTNEIDELKVKYEIEKKGNNGERGSLIITNLRLLWVCHSNSRINLSIGLNTILSINIRKARSKIRGHTQVT